MARSIATIQAEIIAAKNADANLSGLSSSSATATWRLWTFVQATVVWTMEKLYDLHVLSVNDTIARLKPHRLQWYAEMAKRFQFGDTLLADTDVYAVIDESKKVVQYAAAVEAVKGVRLKVARENAGDLGPLTPAQLNALQTYMGRVKDAGVKLYYTNAVPDSLRLTYDIYYDPLILDATGARIDGTSATPVQDAIDDFLKNDLPFNGVFLPSSLTDKLQQVDGVMIPHLLLAQAAYGVLPYVNVGAKYTPDAGYLRITSPGNLILNFIPQP